ncbi:DUF4013 domain-containing protein [Thermofilum pendens]|uniref:DUF4013 domain-containing protein n=1 Tax=Thermofilum pendens (strain DSM 2475 / Hrk 5) TaxID=368408 RepID=A1S163_THEPD|nr:DUF4013 domain-containing protein [Thermofilum pendens]ABL79193.1 hypothetical protein Tpen_1798 [Thermofilum pendens Hrk 5]
MQKMDPGSIISKSIDFSGKLIKDPGNLLLLIVLSIVPIINFIVIGYFVYVVRHDLEEPPKLDTSKLGDYFVEGLKVFLASLIILVPVLILGVLAGLVAGLAYPLGAFPFYFHRAFVLALFIPVLFVALAIAFIAVPLLAIVMRTGDLSKILAFQEALSLIQSYGLVDYAVLFLVLVVVGFLPYYVHWLLGAILAPFIYAFTFKALSLLVNIKYPAKPAS